MEYVRDRAGVLAGGAVSMVFAGALLMALGVDGRAIGLLELVLAVCLLLPLLADWLRRRRFYRAVEETGEGPDGLFLPDALPEPDFWEGELLCRRLGELGRAGNDRLGQARRESREYREYVETWIHEVKTPIASARLLLENHPGTLADALEEELFQIDRYVEQALFYARSGTAERDYRVRTMALEESVRAAVRQYARPLIRAGFRLELGEWKATVYTDPKWVEFILGQLLANAVQYRSEQPVLRFACRCERDAVLLTVADNGIGIPAEDLPRVFDKGFTGANGRRAAQRSTGLGLYLCRKLCVRLGLSIRLDSQPGQGTEVTLVFPRGRFHQLEDWAGSAPAEQMPIE